MVSPTTDNDQARKVARAELMTRTFLVVVAVVVTLALGVLVFLAVQGQQRGKENQELLREVKAQGIVIKSCTTPGQPCFQAGQKRTAGAVGSINQVAILAAGCSIGVTGSVTHRVAVIQACVTSLLAKAHH